MGRGRRHPPPDPDGHAMIILGSCVSGDGARFREVLLPTIRRVLGPADQVMDLPGEPGICQVYNRFIEVARTTPDCEALVLLHDDVEIIDPDFRSKVLAALRPEGVGLVGVIGASRIPSLAWWDSSRRSGLVFENRRLMDLGPRDADVDVVDGLMLAIAPRAFRDFEFDHVTFPQFHGYDLDFALQLREAGLRVRLAPIDLFHRTGPTSDLAAFHHASTALAAKWPRWIHPQSRIMAIRRWFREQCRRSQRLLRRARHLLRRDAPDARPPTRPPVPTPPAHPILVCVACGGSTSRDPSSPSGPRSILVCEDCGTGHTWPQPIGDRDNDHIWQTCFGGERISRREDWFREARTRMDWLQLYLPHGLILELGPGTGEFLSVAGERRFQASGVEPSEWAAQRARELGVEITVGQLEDWIAEHPGLRPDAVALWHVLEHVADPVALLGEVATVLRPGGILVLEVPNFASVDARRLGVDWQGATVDEHRFHFTPDGLGRMLTAAGFEIECVLPFSPRIYDGPQRTLELRNRALRDGTPWPSLDLLRISARTPSSEQH